MFPTLGCVHTLPHGSLPWAPVLACSTQFFGLRAFLSGCLILSPPTLGFSHTRHWSWGTHGACSLCPHISTASQGSAHLPHTDLALHLILLPRVGHGLAQGLPPECHVCASRIRPSVLLLAMGPGPEVSCLLRKGKAKAWGLMGKVFYKWHQ